MELVLGQLWAGIRTTCFCMPNTLQCYLLLIPLNSCDTDEAQYRQAAQNLVDSGLTTLGYEYFSL